MRRLNLSLDLKHDLWTYLVLYSVKWKYWNVRCPENEILAYILTSLRKKKVNISLDLKHDMWTYLVLYSVKWKYWNDPCAKMRFILYGYMFDIYEGWACPSTFLGAKDDIWTYWVLNLVYIKYWDDPCRENEILAYMVICLIYMKVELVPRRSLARKMIFEPIGF